MAEGSMPILHLGYVARGLASAAIMVDSMKVHLIHWRPEEAAPRIERLRALGHEVVYVPPDNSGILKHVRNSAPQALIIDLTRLPAHGKVVGVEMRRVPRIASIPILYVEGDPAKVEAIKALLPDAIYTSWPRIGAALKKAKPLDAPIVPRSESSFEQYAGTPLAKKLGIKPGMKITLLNAPDGFDRATADFPEDLEWLERPSKSAALLFLFAESQAELETDFAPCARTGLPIWVFWPKQASCKRTDLTQHVARTVGHDYGYTDCKVCSFDATWSGFLFRLKRQ
jgi:hypothetical protein